MKLVVEKVGRIERAEIEIRPLTVFIGENGTGKTWTAMGLFALLSQMRPQGGGRTRMDGAVDEMLRTRATEIIERAKQASGVARFEIYRSELVDALPSEVRLWIDHTDLADSVGKTMPLGTRMSLALTQEEFADGLASHLRLSLTFAPDYNLTKELFDKGADRPYTTTSFGSHAVLPELDVTAALGELLLGLRAHVRVLPVERELLAPIFVQILQKQISLLPGLADFVDLLAASHRRSHLAGEEHREALGAAVRQVMGGRFRFEGVERSLAFAPHEAVDELQIPISATASIQKSLVGLQLFLETAERGDVLIIDEPELSAHPEAQVKLVELFALMIRRGIQLVILTHSPYIVDHLSTLIELSRLDDTKRARVVDALALKNAEAYLKPEEVGVWQFNKDGSVTSVYDEESGSINWSTFTRVTNQESITLNRILDEADGKASERA